MTCDNEQKSGGESKVTCQDLTPIVPLSDGKAAVLQQWVWLRFKGLSDLYVVYVDVISYYLASQMCFTYAHLEKLVKAGGVSTLWEEKIWRDMLALRPENMDTDAPAFFIKDADTNTNKW